MSRVMTKLYQAQCGSKRHYATEADALQAYTSYGSALHAYQCPWCHDWHRTKQPQCRKR